MVMKSCEECGEENENKYLGKIRGKLLCKKCRKEVRLNHRAETFEMTDEKEKAKILALQKEQEHAANQAYYKKHIKKVAKEESKGVEPKIKGSTRAKARKKSNSYITIQERQNFLRMLMARGLSFKDAKDRVRDLVKEQIRVREVMKGKNKSEKQIKQKQQQMIEDLWKY